MRLNAASERPRQRRPVVREAQRAAASPVAEVAALQTHAGNARLARMMAAEPERTRADLAAALTTWLTAWPEAQLAADPVTAHQELVDGLAAAGYVHTENPNADAKRNSATFPDIRPLQLRDLRSVIVDLADHGPTPGFIPAVTRARATSFRELFAAAADDE